MAIEVNWTTQGKVRVATLKGRVDSSNANEFQRLVTERVGEGNDSLVLEFSEIGFISSAGLRIVLQLAKTYSKPKFFAVCGLADTVDEVFRISGFNRVVKIYPTLAKAVKAA